MKRTRILGVCLLVLWLFVACVCPATAETPADAARTLVWKSGALTSEDQTAAFWEYPQLTAGQTRRNGSLTLTNQGIGSVTVTLDAVRLPYDDEEALAYLNALRLTIRDGDRVLYDGAFSRLGDDGLTQPVTVKGGETRRLSIDLACDFAYEGAAACGQVLYWDWQVSTSWLGFVQPVLDAWMFWVPALLLIVALIVWLRVRRARKQKSVTAESPTPQPKTPTETLPPTAPRTPVTLSIDPDAKPAKPAKPTAPKPARRRKAAHAAPRHAKKK